MSWPAALGDGQWFPNNFRGKIRIRTNLKCKGLKDATTAHISREYQNLFIYKIFIFVGITNPNRSYQLIAE
jgi:hypothetical protein